ncbi:MAG: glycosyltransferase family 4 protein [Chloroflexi bacterium]|nr:glycosyltransferase family 4 protein [Chloroflexota bacterium]
MKIGIDYTAAIRQGAGVGRHTRSLVATMLEQEPLDTDFVLFYAAGGLNQSQQTHLYSLERHRPANVKYVRLPFSEPELTRLWQRLKIPLPLEWLAWMDNPFPFPAPLSGLDVFHFPDFALPPHRKGKGLVTIHDLSFMVVPECAEAGLRRYLTAAVPHAVKRANRVIVVSENIKHELVERLGTPPEKIKVVYNGVGPQFRPFNETERFELEEVRQRHKLPKHFALFVSTIEPRKNLTRLVEAWAEVKQTPAGRDRKLVLAGRRGWLYEPIFRRISDLKLTEEITWLDFVPDVDLPALYNLAELFLFPSLYEGFGIPPLEALACGTPVVTADNTALREVFEGAAVLCQATNTVSITEAILTTLTSLDGDRHLVTELRAAGLNRAKQFTWERAAGETLALYREMAGLKFQ